MTLTYSVLCESDEKCRGGIIEERLVWVDTEPVPPGIRVIRAPYNKSSQVVGCSVEVMVFYTLYTEMKRTVERSRYALIWSSVASFNIQNYSTARAGRDRRGDGEVQVGIRGVN